MAKASGSTRLLRPIPVSARTLNQIYNDVMSSDMYDKSKSFVDEKYGAFFAQAKGRQPDDNEKMAAMYFVKKGISIRITSEGDIRFATAIKPDGNPKFADGIASVYNYEQKTIERDTENIINNFKRGIQHAVDKKADIAFIFDRYGLGHREQVEKAMKAYKLPAWGKLPKRVIVMNDEGKYFEHIF